MVSHVKGYQALPLPTFHHRRVGVEPGNKATKPLRELKLNITTANSLPCHDY